MASLMLLGVDPGAWLAAFLAFKINEKHHSHMTANLAMPSEKVVEGTIEHHRNDQSKKNSPGFFSAKVRAATGILLHKLCIFVPLFWGSS